MIDQIQGDSDGKETDKPVEQDPVKIGLLNDTKGDVQEDENNPNTEQCRGASFGGGGGSIGYSFRKQIQSQWNNPPSILIEWIDGPFQAKLPDGNRPNRD